MNSMPPYARIAVVLLLVAAAAWSLHSSPARSARPDPLVTLMTGGLLGLACALAAAAAHG